MRSSSHLFYVLLDPCSYFIEKFCLNVKCVKFYLLAFYCFVCCVHFDKVFFFTSFVKIKMCAFCQWKSKLKIRHHFSSAKQVNRIVETKTGRKFQKFKAKSQQKYFQHTHALV